MFEPLVTECVGIGVRLHETRYSTDDGEDLFAGFTGKFACLHPRATVTGELQLVPTLWAHEVGEMCSKHGDEYTDE